MPLTVDELPDYLRRLTGRLRDRAPARAVYAMGLAYQRVVTDSMRGDSPSPPGTPPARVSGTLARSIRSTPARLIRDYAATCTVSPHTVYARIQQYGGDIYPRHMLRAGPREAGSSHSPARLGELGFLSWTGKDGRHFSRHVHLPARPYMVMSSEARSACHAAAVNAVAAMLP